jgi:hypothetical protein
MRALLRFSLLAVALAAGTSTILAQAPAINYGGVGMSNYSPFMETMNFWSIYGTHLSSGSGTADVRFEYYYSYCSDFTSAPADCVNNGQVEIPAGQDYYNYAGHDLGCAYAGCYWYESSGQINFFAYEAPPQSFETLPFESNVYVTTAAGSAVQTVDFYSYYIP